MNKTTAGPTVRMMTAHIDLEIDQMEELVPIMEQCSAANRANKKGIVLAQVFDTSMAVTFIEYEYAKKIQAVLARRAAALRARQS